MFCFHSHRGKRHRWTFRFRWSRRRKATFLFLLVFIGYSFVTKRQHSNALVHQIKPATPRNATEQLARDYDNLDAFHLEQDLRALRYEDLSTMSSDAINAFWQQSQIDLNQAIAAVLPVSVSSASSLQGHVLSLLSPTLCLAEILILCHVYVLAQCKSAIQSALVTHSMGWAGSVHDQPALLLRSWHGWNSQTSSIPVNLVSALESEWLLVLDEEALAGLNNETLGMLINPKDVHVPVGPRGIAVTKSKETRCLSSTSLHNPQLASYLLPPFLINHHITALEKSRTMSQNFFNSGSFGLVLGHYEGDLSWCDAWQKTVYSTTEVPGSLAEAPSSINQVESTATFVVLLPSLGDLQSFSPTLCRLQARGSLLQIALYEEVQVSPLISSDLDSSEFVTEQCTLQYDLTVKTAGKEQDTSTTEEWISAAGYPEFIIIADSDVQDTETFNAFSDAESSPVLIRLNRSDLFHGDWIGSLSVAELKNWFSFQIDISIITHQRPQSLSRLLRSLSKAHFFGDSVNVRINMEQSADPETLRTVEAFQWAHGQVFVHHRVVRGGLLPAVVEAWYPASNHSYGLLLEDDIELSPLFYAWVKMNILRYRYGSSSNLNTQLFGISLYQQKIIELDMAGRKDFNPRDLFSDAQLPDITTPFLSQIPCSWGAVYFPEHWREFHQYITLRLSNNLLGTSEDIVPNVRSNNWTRSWKKYFIELVYLRGYVMLYPNYEGFASLSTNHMELGSHVTRRTKKSQEQFVLPLMPARNASNHSGLLELPDNQLPSWGKLPVLNLTGQLVDSESIQIVGENRKAELTLCDDSYEAYDVQDLFCR